jgi:hypothetical protein
MTVVCGLPVVAVLMSFVLLKTQWYSLKIYVTLFYGIITCKQICCVCILYLNTYAIRYTPPVFSDLLETFILGLEVQMTCSYIIHSVRTWKRR